MKKITDRILEMAVRVHTTLGPGFLEKVYENAMVHECRKVGLNVEQQKPIKVYYDGVVVGDFVADLVVEGQVLIELKAISRFEDVHSAICINYLKATALPVCLLLNFGATRIQIKRLVGETYETMQLNL